MNNIRNSARNYPCIRCGRDGETRGSHYNGQRQHMLGKGRGIKCSDAAVAHFCQQCDSIFTEGHNEHWDNKDERSEEFLFYCVMTLRRLLEDGVLKA